MSLYRFVADVPSLRAPVLVVAFDAWVDAGGAASSAAAHLASDGVRLVEFESDALLDYRTRRPILDVIDGEAKQLTWQEITVVHVPAGQRDVLVLTGPEPDHRWKEFAASVHEIAVRLGIVEAIAMGGLPAAVPHTRPVPLIATASPRDLLGPEDRRPEGILRVPAAALSVVQMRLAENGIPTLGFFVQIPHYVTPVYWAGTLALLERVERRIGVELDLEAIRAQVQDQRVELDALVEQRPEVKTHVEQLEAMTPEVDLSSGPIPSGDEIAAEVERFLRNARGDQG